MPQQEAGYTLAESLVFKGHNYLPIPETCCEGIQRAICCILQQIAQPQMHTFRDIN